MGPAALDLDVGPLIRASQQQRVWDFLSDAQAAGIMVCAVGASALGLLPAAPGVALGVLASVVLRAGPPRALLFAQLAYRLGR